MVLPLSKGRAIKEKITFFKPFFPTAKVPTAIKLKGGRGKGLNGTAIKKNFFATSLMQFLTCLRNTFFL